MRLQKEQVTEKQPAIFGRYEAFIMALLLLGLYLTSLYGYLLFHSLAELFSILVALAIFVVAWNSRQFMSNNYLLFIGIAFLFIAIIDIVHTLAFKGMNIFQGYAANLPTQLWIVARYMQGLSLLIAPVFFGRRLRLSIAIPAYAAVTVLALISIFYWQNFPTCYIEGVGLTPFKKISEYIICSILAGSVGTLYWKRKEFDKEVFRLLVASIAFTIATELMFTFYVGVYDISNLIGHILRIVSYYLIYKAIVETGLMWPYQFLFRDLKQNEQKLTHQATELAQANIDLQHEIEQRRQSEQEAKSIISTAMDGFWLTDTEGHFLDVNDAYCTMIGYSREELLNMSVPDVEALEKPEDTARHIKEVIAAGYDRFDTRHRTKDGKIFDIEVSVNYMDYKGGRFFVFLRDITQRKQIEEEIRSFNEKLEQEIQERTQLLNHTVKALQEEITERKQAEEKQRATQELFQKTFHNSPVASVLTKLPLRTIVDANTAFEETFGYKAAEVIGKPVSELDLWADPVERERVAKALLESGSVRDYDFVFKTKSGKTGYGIFNSEVIDQGLDKYVLTKVMDITKRKQAEEQQKLNEARLESLIKIAQYQAADVQDLLDLALVEAIRLTDSKLGYIYFYDEGERKFTLHSWSREVMKECTIQEPKTAYDLDKTGLWGEVVRQRKPVILNDFQSSHPLKKGYPEGHATLHKFLSIPVFMDERIVAVLGLANKATDYDQSDVQQVTLLMDSVWKMVERKQIQDELTQSFHKIQQALDGIISATSRAMESRDPYTGGHQRRVVELASAIAEEMGLSEDRITGLRMAATIHDIGKISVPAEILNKPGKINEMEFGIIRAHAQTGYDILKDLEFPWPIAQVTYQHHERLDGSDYPQGLTADNIILEARITAVADVVEAMASHRPYRPALGIDKALEEISQKKGTIYDSEVVDACLRLFAENKFKFD